MSVRFKNVDATKSQSTASKKSAKGGGISQLVSTNVGGSMRINDVGEAFHDEQMERGFMEIIGKFADGKDKCFLYTGLFCAFLFGASFPAFFYLFGLLVDELGSSTSVMNYEFSRLNEICLITIILGAVVFLVSFG